MGNVETEFHPQIRFHREDVFKPNSTPSRWSRCTDGDMVKHELRVTS